MTPAIRKWAEWWIKETEGKYDLWHWFDISDCVSDPAIVSAQRWLPDHRPPFKKTTVVCNSVINGVEHEIMLSLSGSCPDEGIRFAMATRRGNEEPRVYQPGWYAVRNNQLYTDAVKGEPERWTKGREIALMVASLFYRALYESKKTAHLMVIEKTFSNQWRMEKGKLPKYTWETLVVGSEAIVREDRGGTHASPRQHDRRGHQRRLRSGKVVWVKPCKVGSAARGAVFKDYAVRTLQ